MIGIIRKSGKGGGGGGAGGGVKMMHHTRQESLLFSHGLFLYNAGEILSGQ